MSIPFDTFLFCLTFDTPSMRIQKRSCGGSPFWWWWGLPLVSCWGVWVSRRFTASSRLQRFRRCPFLGTPITPNFVVILLFSMTVSLFVVSGFSGCEVKLDQQPVLIPSLVHPTFKRFTLLPSLIPTLRFSSQFRRITPKTCGSLPASAYRGCIGVEVR